MIKWFNTIERHNVCVLKLFIIFKIIGNSHGKRMMCFGYNYIHLEVFNIYRLQNLSCPLFDFNQDREVNNKIAVVV